MSILSRAWIGCGCPYLLTTLLAALFLTGCATPMGVDRVGQNRAYPQITANVITPGILSADTITVLQRYGLVDDFQKSPDAALKQLHEAACRDDRSDVLYALAELSFYTAQDIYRDDLSWPRSKSRKYYLASATYAYLYLFRHGHASALDPLDRPTRVACDIYNRGLGHSFLNDKHEFAMDAGAVELPTGRLKVSVSRPGFKWGEEYFNRFLPSDEFLDRGIEPRNRDSGLGVPLIALQNPKHGGKPLPPFIGPRLSVPATAFLRIQGGVKDLAGGTCTASLELYSTFDERMVEVEGKPIRLEADVTTPMAYNLNSSPVWSLDFAQLLSGVQRVKSNVYITQPYQPGRIPVVFVHGTASNPAYWVPMFNGLLADPVLRSRCQFWYFVYNTGQPIAYSSYLLRTSLANVVKAIDPEGKDPALKQMVMIGHSQGGLLTKMQVVNTGDTLWKNVTDEPIDQLKLKPADRELLRACMFVSASPYVKRVIFVSTPHRGSFRIGGWVANLARKLIALPGNVAQVGADMMTQNPELKMPNPGGRMPTSIDNMSPKSPLLRTLVDIPLAPGVTGHSIIPSTQTNNLAIANDTIVKYTSAHLDGMQSEYHLIGTHSCQDKPLAIEEVRRILLLHLRDGEAK